MQRETRAFDNVSPSQRHSPGALKAANDREGRRPFGQRSATFARTVHEGWPPILIEIIEIVKRRRAPALSHPVVIPRDVKSTGENVCRFAAWPSASIKAERRAQTGEFPPDGRKRDETRILSRDNSHLVANAVSIPGESNG